MGKIRIAFTSIFLAVVNMQPCFGYTETVTYVYDDLNRLESATAGSGVSQSYTYDEKHNRLSTIQTAEPSNTPTAVNDSYNVAQDTALNIGVPGVLSNDNNPLSAALTVSEQTLPSHGTLSLNSNGSFNYAPHAGFFGSDNFTYQAGNGSEVSNHATVEFIVSATNPPPNAVDDSITINEDVTATIFVLANDSDPNSQTLSLVSVDYSGTGSAAKSGNNVTYTPPANFSGTESFTYVVSDSGGATSTASVTVVINAENDVPETQNDEIWLRLGMTAFIGVLSNDTDIDTDTLSILSVSYAGSSTVSHDGYFIAYTPSASLASGDSETFSYTVTDGNGGTQPATITVHLSNNNAPIARNDEYFIGEDQTVELNVLNNDFDSDGDTLTITSVSLGSGGPGNVYIIDGNRISFTPPLNSEGAENIHYTIEDTHGLSSTAIALVHVSRDQTLEAPIATNDSASTPIDKNVSINVLGNDSSPDLNSIAIFSHDTATDLGGTITKSGNVLTYSPSAGFEGTDSFTYTIISDNNVFERFDTATVTIKVYDPAKVINPIIYLLIMENE